MPQQEPIGVRSVFWIWMGTVIAGFAAMFLVVMTGR